MATLWYNLAELDGWKGYGEPMLREDALQAGLDPYITCPVCDGTGEYQESEKMCAVCGGMWDSEKEGCFFCGSKASVTCGVPEDKSHCSKCYGTGYTRNEVSKEEVVALQTSIQEMYEDDSYRAEEYEGREDWS